MYVSIGSDPGGITHQPPGNRGLVIYGATSAENPLES